MITIWQAETEEDLNAAREMLLDYINWLGSEAAMEDVQREASSLPGAYAPQRRGALLLGELDGETAGFVALKAFAGDFNTTPVAEIKRGFVLPFARGRQVGRKLVEAAMERARENGI